MRQTPFGVWNAEAQALPRGAGGGCNEADAFRRLEPRRLAARRVRLDSCNEADAFRRLEPL